jgi:anti-sigma regulatory factor (Ser/Thr protein kinase)
VPKASVSLGASTGSAAAARHFARTTLDDAGWDGEATDRVELLVSEVVTNAVLHAHSGPRMTIDLTSDVVRITVEDDSPMLPMIADVSPEAVRGRGMLLVDLLASAWGTEAVDQGKCVWFVVKRSSTD